MPLGLSFVLLIYDRILDHASSATSADIGTINSSAAYGKGSCQNNGFLLLSRDLLAGVLDKAILRIWDVACECVGFLDCTVDAICKDSELSVLVRTSVF